MKKKRGRKPKDAITRAEMTAKRKKELEAAKLAQERNKGKVRLRINSNTEVLVKPELLEKHGKDYFISKYE